MSYSFDGEFTAPTSRNEVYAVLSRTEKFAPLLPTYKSHQLKEDGSTDVELSVGVGKVRGTGKVNLTLGECEEGVRAQYLGKGKVMGGAFNITASFDLEDAGQDSTRVSWQGELAMFGRLVSLAGGMVKPIAERDIKQMIKAIQVEFGVVEELATLPPLEPERGIFARLLAWLKSLFGSG